MMLVRGKRGDSQLNPPSQKEQLATIHKWNTFVKISKPRGEVKTLHWTPPKKKRERERKRKNMLEGKRSGFTLIARPFPQVGAAPPWRGSLWIYSSSTGKRRAQGRHAASPAFWGAFRETHLYTALHLSVGNQVEKKRDGSHSNVLMDLGRPHSRCCSAQLQIPTGVSALLQN